MEKQGKKNTIRKILLVICIIILCASVGILVNFFVHKASAKQTAKSYEELAAEVNDVGSGVTDGSNDNASDTTGSKSDKDNKDINIDAMKDKDSASDATKSDKDIAIETIKKDPNQILKDRGIEIPQKNLNWDELHQINSDIYAWLYVPGTVIDYPVVQRDGDNQYYLMRNLDGSEGFPGCIFSETYSKKDFSSKNTVLYGHNMLDGSMFASLLYFVDKGFFDENRFIFIYTPDGSYAYEIFAAYYDDDINLSLAYDYDKEEAFAGYLYRILGLRDMRNHFLKEYKPDGKSHIITLSTCVDAVSDGARYLLAGVLLNDPYRD